jgi:hypothetical protein
LSIIFEHVPSFSQHIWDDPNFHILQASKTASDPVGYLRPANEKMSMATFSQRLLFFQETEVSFVLAMGTVETCHEFPNFHRFANVHHDFVTNDTKTKMATWNP